MNTQAFYQFWWGFSIRPSSKLFVTVCNDTNIVFFYENINKLWEAFDAYEAVLKLEKNSFNPYNSI